MFEAVIIASLVVSGINTAVTVGAYGRSVQAMDSMSYAAQRVALLQQAKDGAVLLGKAVRTAQYCKHPVGDRLYDLALRETSSPKIPGELRVAFRQALDQTVAQGPDLKSMEAVKFSCGSAKARFDLGLSKLPG